MNNVLRSTLVLPEDLLIIPVTDLPDDIRSKLGDGGEEFAITRPLAREPSKLIDAAAADLIEQFRAPRTIVQAVISYSKKNQVDPEHTLEDSLPLLRQLLNSGLLLPEGSEQASRIEATYKPNAQFGRFRISRCIQVLEDSELYQARDSVGGHAAVKVARVEHIATMQRRLNREADALKRLAGLASPLYIDSGEVDGRPFVATEWLSVIDAVTAAAALREDGERQALLDLLVQIARAYAAVHRMGVIHGDVHPGNVFVGRDGKVTLIDFGLAQLSEVPPDPYLRGGVGFFFEPEYARAALEHLLPPPATQKSEQFTVGALLYLLVTGHHYMDFTLQQEEMFRQISEAKPLLFSECDVEPWPEVEAVLSRTLAVEPDARYAAMTDVADALGAVRLPCSAPAKRGQSGSDAFVDDIISHVGIDGGLYQGGLPQGPLCSVNFGGSGIAYALHRLACRRDEPRLLAFADAWIMKMHGDAERETAFYNPSLDMTEATIGRVSPYHTRPGMHLVQSMVADARGESAMRDAAAQAFLRDADALCVERDLCLGRCGTLLGSAMLLEILPHCDDPLFDGIRKFGTKRLNDLWEETEVFDALNGSRHWPNLGIAHGWAGLLYATLRWSTASGATLPDSFRVRLDQLLQAARPTGRGVTWPWRQHAQDGDDASMPGWCNGSAGIVHLACLAHRVFKDDACLQAAEGAAWHAWEAGTGPVDLCCGYAGRAYALLELFKSTQDGVWLDRARSLATRAVYSAPQWRSAEHPRHSLYKGELGLALLIEDLKRPDEASMPFFGSEAGELRAELSVRAEPVKRS